MYGLSANGKANNLLKGFPLHLKTCRILIEVVCDCTMQTPSFQVAFNLECQRRKILEVTPKLDLLQGRMYNYQLSLFADPETANVFISFLFR